MVLNDIKATWTISERGKSRDQNSQASVGITHRFSLEDQVRDTECATALHG